MKFVFSKLGNRICIKTEKENSIYMKKVYVQSYKAKRILDNIKKNNWDFEISDNITELLA